MNRILVAEDEERISSFIEKGLRAGGYAVTLAGDGPSALEAAMSGGYDLVLLDLGLPLLDGFAVLQRLRQAGNRTPVIILTARSGLNDTVAPELQYPDNAIGTMRFHTGCSENTVPTSAFGTITCNDYLDCDPDAALRWCTHPGGHDWPGNSANQAIWDFFQTFQ